MVINVCETMTLSHNRAFVAYKTQIRLLAQLVELAVRTNSGENFIFSPLWLTFPSRYQIHSTEKSNL